MNGNSEKTVATSWLFSHANERLFAFIMHPQLFNRAQFLLVTCKKNKLSQYCAGLHRQTMQSAKQLSWRTSSWIYQRVVGWLWIRKTSPKSLLSPELVYWPWASLSLSSRAPSLCCQLMPCFARHWETEWDNCICTPKMCVQTSNGKKAKLQY